MACRKICIGDIANILGIQPTFKKEAGYMQDVLEFEINGLNLCNRKTEYNSIISYSTNSKFSEVIENNSAVKALIVSPYVYEDISNILSPAMIYFITESPESCFYNLHEYLYKQTDFYDKFNFNPVIGVNCDIHPSAVIENGVIIADNVTIGPNSVIRKGSIIDNNVRIGCCTVIGAEGFQALHLEDGNAYIATHVGRTHICKDVYIGDNTIIGNSLFEGECVVGENTKISNHVEISHNCNIGSNCIITAGAIMLGSSNLEDDVWIAPNSVIMNKVTVESNAFVGTMTLVTKNVEKGLTVVGIPARNWHNCVGGGGVKRLLPSSYIDILKCGYGRVCNSKSYLIAS